MWKIPTKCKIAAIFRKGAIKVTATHFAFRFQFLCLIFIWLVCYNITYIRQGTNSWYESGKICSVFNHLTFLPPLSDIQISFLIWSAGWGSLWARHHSCLRSEKFGPKLAQCSTAGYYYQRWTSKSDKKLFSLWKLTQRGFISQPM